MHPSFEDVRRQRNKIQFLESECKRHNVPMKPPKSVDDFLTKISTMRRIKKKANNLFFEEIENDIDQKEKFVQQQTKKEKDIYECFILLYEYKKVLNLGRELILHGENANFEDEDRRPFSVNNSMAHPHEESKAEMLATHVSVANIVGTIQISEKERFKRLIFRATRGNALCHFKDFDSPIIDFYGNEIHKCVYVVLFPEGEATREKINRICDSFLGEKYDIPIGNIDEKIQEVNNKIKETKNIVEVTNQEIKKYLISINQLEDSDVAAIQVYKWFICKEKSLYNSLNKLKSGDKLLIGLFWLPNSKIDDLNKKIIDIKEDRNISGPQIWRRENHKIQPPTFFRLNEFTASFQEITNTYGVPMYKEINPSVFAIVTFPFLFGVMYGDIGHGFLLFLLGCFLCLAAEQLKTSAIGALVGARYLILMMGFFAVFCGLMYNDFMSIPIEISSCYEFVQQGSTYAGRVIDGCMYSFGMDPSWYLASNELTYFNGFKMKMSVIFGVAQMSLGIFMKALNSCYFGRLVDFFFEFIPQIILLMCLFGFMDMLIIIKWLTDWTGKEGRAPSIIAIMINMFLKSGEIEEGTDALLVDADTQKLVCIILVLVALVTVPLMLLVKPLYLK